MSTDSNHHHHHHTSESYASPPVTLTLTVFLIVFFVVGFLSIYLCRCFMLYVTDALLSRSPSGNAAQPNGSTAPGLDPSIISTFPTFVYSTVKNLRQDKCGLECAVCLSEFEDEDVLRLLPVCNHVFHSECIDLWLKSHTTCPICRRSLDPSQKLPEKSPDMVVTIPPEINRQDNESREDNYSISIKDEEEEEEEEEEEMVVVERKQRHESASAEMAVQDGEHEGERFSRFHSTGHSIINIGSEDDRFTLRLPENIKEQILRGHHGTGSCDF